MKYLKMMIIILSCVFLSGCGNKKEESVNGYKDIQEAIMNMESYTAEIQVTYISNKGENVYDIMQVAKKDGKYILETTSPETLKGNVIMYDGRLIWHYNPSVDAKISVIDNEKLERREINLFSFLQNHLKSNNIAVETSTSQNEKDGESENIYTILEAVIPSDNTYFSTEKLWLNNSSNLPEKLVIYDKEGKERVIVNFDNFVYNPTLEDSVFDIESIKQDE